MLLEEFDNKKAYLYESVMLTEARTFRLGESLGNAIMEADLTADQVNQLFQELEAGAAAAGGNRTMLGKGVDAARFVKASYDELKQLAQNSGPVSGFDAAFAKGAQALGQSLGGDQGVMKYINKYREFAKAHPTAQKVIYGSLVLAIGISAAMSGSAAAVALKPAIVGVMKATDKLLQGESFSTAAMAGAEVFAAGEIAKTVGGWVKGLTTTGSAAPVDVPPSGGAADTTQAGDATAQQPTAGGKSGAARFGASQYSVDAQDQTMKLRTDLAQKMGLSPDSPTKAVGGVPVEIGGKPVPSELLTPEQAKSIEAARKMAIQMGNPDPLAGRPPVTGTAAATATTDAVAPGTLSNSQAAKMGVSKLKQMVASGEITDEQSYERAVRKVAKDLRPGLKPDPTTRGMNFDISDEIKRYVDYEVVPKDGSQFTGTKADYIKKFIQDNGGTPDEDSFGAQEKLRQGQRSGYSNQASTVSTGATSNTNQFEGMHRLSETQLNTLFMLAEAGMWDKAKAAGAAIAGSKAAQVIGQTVQKGIQKAGQVGRNLANKVTADKLQKAWVAAGSPPDSDAIYDLMLKAGVDQRTLDSVFQKMSIEQYKQIMQQILKLDPTIKQQLAQFLKQSLGPETAMAEEDHHLSRQNYHAKNNSVYGKILAKDGVAVLTDYEEATRLAKRFNGSLIKPARNRYMVKINDLIKEAPKTNKVPKGNPSLTKRWIDPKTLNMLAMKRQYDKDVSNLKPAAPTKLDTVKRDLVPLYGKWGLPVEEVEAWRSSRDLDSAVERAKRMFGKKMPSQMMDEVGVDPDFRQAVEGLWDFAVKALDARKIDVDVGLSWDVGPNNIARSVAQRRVAGVSARTAADLTMDIENILVRYRRKYNIDKTGNRLPVRENDAHKPTKTKVDYDPELASMKRYAASHYPNLTPDAAFQKLMQRSMQHGEKDDDRQDAEIKALAAQVANIEQNLNNLRKAQAKTQPRLQPIKR